MQYQRLFIVNLYFSKDKIELVIKLQDVYIDPK